MRRLLTALLVFVPGVAVAGWWLGQGTGGGSGSQTPLTGSVDGAGFDITGLDDITMDDLTADAITATTVTASGAVAGSICSAAGGAEEDNSLEVTLIDPGPPNPAAAGARRMVWWDPTGGAVVGWWDVDTTANPNTVERPFLLGPTSTNGTGLGSVNNAILLTDGTQEGAKPSTVVVDANGEIPTSKIDVSATNGGTTGLMYCTTTVNTTLDSGDELCAVVGTNKACVGYSISYSTLAGVAVVTTAACGTDQGGTGLGLCAPCQ